MFALSRPQVLFEPIHGYPVPRLPLAFDGSIRVPDGLKFLTIRQAAERFNLPEETLEAVYAEFVGDALKPEDAERIFDPATYSVGAPEARKELSLRALHVSKFPNLSDAQYQTVVATCEARGFGPWSELVWADLNEHGELVIGTTIAGQRVLATRSGVFDGSTSPMWCAPDRVWVDSWGEDPPFAAKVGVRRTDRTEVTCGIANWADYRHLAKRERDRGWRDRPALRLAIAAESAAMRTAFPTELANLYVREEISFRTVQAVRPEPAIEWPESRQQFELMLIDWGLGARRQSVIQEFWNKHPGVYNTDPTAFYKLVLRAIIATPMAYGASIPELIGA